MNFDDFYDWIWTDESKANMFGSDGIRYTWRKPNSPLSARDFTPTAKYGGGKLLFWICFCARRVGELVKIDGIMNADDYISILKVGYFKSLRKWSRTVRNTMFMQHKDSEHKADKTIKFVHEKKLKLVDWPAQSPDLNPLENLWAIVKQRVYNFPILPKNKDKLWARVQEVWYSITPKQCRKLIASAPERIQAVAKSKGRYTRY